MSPASQPPTSAYPPREPLPHPFGRYTLRQILGEGGMGRVFRAYDEVLQIEVALKVPRPELMAYPDCRERFHHEARAAARLDHPNFARVFDVGEHEGLLYLTMRYVAGPSLAKERFADRGEGLALVHGLALALGEAHRRGVIHRDLKPANILLGPDRTPVITDFGLALRLDTADPRLTDPGGGLGTPHYMSPEQVRSDLAPLGPACDIYALGVILYELLTGKVPFPGQTIPIIFDRILHDEPEPPGKLCPGLDPALEAACLKALAKRPEDRFASMEEFASALGECLAGRSTPRGPASGSATLRKPLLDRDCLRFVFVGYGEHAPAGALADRLFLDAGNDLRPGVLDHHQQTTAAGSTASLVLRRPDLMRGAVSERRGPGDPFTLVLHERPDLDGVASAYLAIALLTTGAFPPGAEALARYVDRVDEGAVGMSLANLYALYAAYLQLVNRLVRRSWNSPHACWQDCVRLGLQVVDYAVTTAELERSPLPEVDAFATPGVLGPDDRREVEADASRYLAKLRDPACRARVKRLRLPGQFGGRVEVEWLRVRDVQNEGDPDRCVFFKDWARTDAAHSADHRGFAALSVFCSEGPHQVRRCILSVSPAGGATLRGLGLLLEEAEARRRTQVFGADDRVTDPATGAARAPRPGYANADPWYDGRAHGFTIVDSPRAGTLLTAYEIEELFLRFGGAT